MHQEEIKTIVREFLEKLTIAVDEVTLGGSETLPLFQVSTKDSGVLIGMNGENLRALNAVLKRIVERRLGAEAASQFLLDVNGYHSRRIEEVRGKARMLAERARTFKYDVEMSPMNAYERMIVHATFSTDPNIATESVGEGKVRHIILKYVQDKQRKKEKLHEPAMSDADIFGIL